MEKKIVIYDPPMCCSSGLCGPNPDNTLIELQNSIDKLQEEGFVIERYIINQSPEKFKENPEIIKLLQEEQIGVLPIITYNEKVVMKKQYPTYDQFISFVNNK